jgi:O-antigen/teichoic acid export membrane protein
MKRHLQNAACGILDYAAYPLGLIAVAPVLIRTLGPAQFGIWAFTMAEINTGAILASGFGDANIQQIALARSTGNTAQIENCFRTTLSIHLLLGVLLAFLAFIAAPMVALHVAPTEGDLRTCRTSLEIGSVCILLRALETVVVSTHRAFERYAESVRISATVRLLTLAVAAMLGLHGAGVLSILVASAVLLVMGTTAQFVRLGSFMSPRSLVPGYEYGAGRTLLELGVFTWLQAAGTAVFGQIDRLFVGIMFGAAAVGMYSICMQVAQPVAGIASSGLHFIFPLLARSSGGSEPRIARPIMAAFACNVLLVSAASVVLLLLGGHLLRSWTTPDVAKAGVSILPLAIVGSALTGLAVTGVYAMLALGRAGAVVSTTALAGIAMLGSITWVEHRYGIVGVAASRLLFGLISLLIYIPLVRALRTPRAISVAPPAPALSGIREGA